MQQRLHSIETDGANLSVKIAATSLLLLSQGSHKVVANTAPSLVNIATRRGQISIQKLSSRRDRTKVLTTATGKKMTMAMTQSTVGLNENMENQTTAIIVGQKTQTRSMTGQTRAENIAEIEMTS